MSFKAVMTIDGKDYNISTCTYGVTQDASNVLKPASETKTTVINVSTESSEDNSLMEWASENYGGRDGSIVFYKDDQAQKMKQMDFKLGFVSYYSEQFGGGTMMINISICCYSLKVGNAEVINAW